MAFLITVFTSAPLAFALHLDPSAFDQHVQRALRATMRDVYGKGLERAEVRQSQSSPMICSKLSTIPLVCRSAMPKGTFIVRQV